MGRFYKPAVPYGNSMGASRKTTLVPRFSERRMNIFHVSGVHEPAEAEEHLHKEAQHR